MTAAHLTHVCPVCGAEESLDALMARSGWAAAELSAALLELELDGQVARLAGQLFQRRRAG